MRQKRISPPILAVLAMAAYGLSSLQAQAPVATPAAAPVATPAAAPSGPAGTVEQITVHGKSLEGNLNGDTADRTVIVYLPPGYTTDSARRYPVVYLLHGYGLQVSGWMRLFRIENGANHAMTGTGSGERAREMILVNPDAYSFYDGSFYSKSVTAGDWETFVGTDLVAYIDAHYRTLANRQNRGLAGHSMGGYGTLRIAMKRPEVFSSLYALSACCAMDKGEPGEQMTTAGTYTTRDQVTALRYPNKGTLARAAAWSPNPASAPFFFDLPVKDGVARPDIQAKWLENSVIPMMEKSGTSLKGYTAVKFDVGTMDNLLAANQQIDAAMTKLGIRHTFETYEGDHNGKIAERLETKVLPFFSANLAFK
jgi:S-formylglutathione hydrolase FrmB